MIDLYPVVGSTHDRRRAAFLSRIEYPTEVRWELLTITSWLKLRKMLALLACLCLLLLLMRQCPLGYPNSMADERRLAELRRDSVGVDSIRVIGAIPRPTR